ncbi:hypothetical protein, conserved [Eimeria maxima]|uniref:Uncharacterized protein n=1 Tax=Eimeria maxima TaxID=5804 RepID=U6MAE8_EIMMA|nr:hypothetical protein, conserved [Eimeria maxima]CDJ59469.1 hypothetical protein, conserved [Eimeria maxima]
MNESSNEKSSPSGAGGAVLSEASPVAEDAAAAAGTKKPQALRALWDNAPDAAASTCVSGSEGSLPSSNQQQQQQQQKLQRESQSSVHCADARPERPTAPGSGESAASRSEQQQQQQQQQPAVQHPSGLALHVATLKRPQGNKNDGSSACGAPTNPLSSDAISSVAAQQRHLGSSSSSCCSSTSIGGELRGLINALSSVDPAAGTGELQQLLQQLLAERDLYKAAFGAAKEELKDLECRQQQLTQALQQSEHERRQERMEQQLAAAAAADRQSGEASGPHETGLQWNGSSSTSSVAQQQLSDSNGNPASSTCSSAEGPYNWLHQLHACIASGTYPRPELLQKSVEQQQQLMRLAEGLQQERESYVEAVACLHSQLREAREDVSLYMSAHATHAADLTAESDEALRAADLWLQHALRVGAKCKYWGMGSVVHSQEAAAASAAASAKAPTLSRACDTETQSEAVSAAAAAALSAAEEPTPGVSVALASAASVYCVPEDSVGDDDGPAAAVAVGNSGATTAAELERLLWGQTGDGFAADRQQLQQHNRQRERNKRLLWFLE